MSTEVAGTTPPLASAIYEGVVRHRRLAPHPHVFDYKMAQLYLDLDEVDKVFQQRWLWSNEHRNVAQFRRDDYLGPLEIPLAEAVRQRVEQTTGQRPVGPIRLLTHLRYFGYVFNPVSFYYCYDAAGENVTAVVAHVTNTPWGESHPYVMGVGAPADRGGSALMRGRFEKRLHVSPLMGMDQVYDWRLTEPAQRLSVHIESQRPGGARTFDATLSLARREITPASLRGALIRYPLLTARITTRIYAQALRLRLGGASYFPHPKSGAAAT